MATITDSVQAAIEAALPTDGSLVFRSIQTQTEGQGQKWFFEVGPPLVPANFVRTDSPAKN